ncbi:MAG: hypothetical protein KKD44_13240 [Proteobacteria bacterium]|nr:hypothetical protein [Pseudomonadota bacterium]
MTYIQLYPVQDALPLITNHEQLPPGAKELGMCLDTTEAEDLYVLVKRGDHLSVLATYTRHLKTGDAYFCDQFDFPLKALSWFPKALEDFRRPPAEGGLHAGAMTSADEVVDGEMLCVESTTSGYSIVNWSRQSPLAFDDSYMPTTLSLSYNFLYRLGFLGLWNSLGEKYERGEL